jgi:tRNA (guanosine-2'-O-)-methyltransferase
MELYDNQVFPGLWEYLTAHITPERRNRLEEVVSLRTRFLTVVVEDIYQAQNASAVLRTCECLGIQDVHIIENENEYQLNPLVVQGSANWLTLNRWNLKKENTEDCLQHLKNEGYQIAATSLHDEVVDLNDFDVKKKTALVFGNEKNGISDEVRKHADVFLRIPMVGFTESFNISVSAAICLYQFMNILKKSDLPWQLSQEEKNALLLEWVSKNFIYIDLMIERFLSENDIF